MTQTPPPNAYYQPPQPMRPEDEKLWATLVHIGGIFFSFVPALVAYLVLKDRGPFIRAHAATALNFQLTMLIASIAVVILTIVTFGLAGFLYFPLAVLVIVFAIIAAVAANKGQFYRYPLSIPFFS